MDKLRVDRGEKRIEVNDEGEYIVLNLNDQSFFPALAAIIEDFNNSKSELEGKGAAIDAMPESNSTEKIAKTKAVTDLNLAIHTDLKNRIDGVFRDEVCRKVFGNIVPGVDLWSDFFEQLAPYIKKYGKERQAKMHKYNPDRTGNA